VSAGAKSPSFCVLPWMHLSVWPDGRVYPCCMADNDKPLGSLRQGTLADAWNSERLRRMRLDMTSGRQSPECFKCFEVERSGMPSLRRRVNEQFAHLTDRAAETQPDGAVRSMRLAYFDVRFSNICNFKCRTCWPELSSAWQADARALWPHLQIPGLIRAAADPERLWKELEPQLEHVEEVYFAGGEPLVMEEHYRVLDRLIELERFDVRLCYNTNFSTLTFKGRDVTKSWSLFKTVRVGASLDGMGARGEYLRKGQVWAEVEANRARLAERCPGVEFDISPTLSVFNALHLADFHREWVERGWVSPEGFHINLLLDPPEYRAQVLPPRLKAVAVRKYRKHVDDVLRGARAGAAERWLAAASFLEAEDHSALLPKTRERTAAVDALRGERGSAVFPELAELLP
jgi:radical SAM protein with 4Fe4S-binding SPASM domain